MPNVLTKEELIEQVEIERNERFDKIHTQELLNIGKNFTEEEQKDICIVVPSKFMLAELERREQATKAIIQELLSVISSVYGKGMSLVEMEETINQIREIVKVKGYEN